MTSATGKLALRRWCAGGRKGAASLDEAIQDAAPAFARTSRAIVRDGD
jgi:hypothetical protein